MTDSPTPSQATRLSVLAGRNTWKVLLLFLKLALVTAFMASPVPEFIYAGF